MSTTTQRPSRPSRRASRRGAESERVRWVSPVATLFGVALLAVAILGRLT
jgi:hypothetical protein